MNWKKRIWSYRNIHAYTVTLKHLGGVKQWSLKLQSKLDLISLYVFYGNHSLSNFLLQVFKVIKTNVIHTIQIDWSTVYNFPAVFVFCQMNIFQFSSLWKKILSLDHWLHAFL